MSTTIEPGSGKARASAGPLPPHSDAAPAPTPTPEPASTPASTPALGAVAGDAPAIATRGLTKQYGRLTALDKLDLVLEKGDVFGFIGPNGAGKSTTMKILAGLLQPTHGDAHVLGRNVQDNGEFVRRNIGYMPDFFGVYEDLTVYEYLEFFASAYRIERRARKRVVNDVLELTDLNYKRDALVDSLSRGMQQRLGLARVLVHDPPVLLLDEPASGLDPRARIEIRELLKELQRLGKTILISSHILSELGEFCNKLGIIERGQLLVTGTIADLMARARAHPLISVQVRRSLSAAQAALERDDRVERVETNDAELLITLRDPNQHHAFLAETLIAANLQIHAIAPQQLKLEDVFLRLTKGIVQ
jgi:ABC-2 type transport system ATP-binding protein